MNDKNRDLATSATSKIYEKVNNALSKDDTDKRWFWELLQNAKDTVAQKPQKVDVRVKLTHKDGDSVVLFEHNGEPFQHSNHRFKFDDPKCLLLADSGKIEEDEAQREDVTGQFGTGFLSTHVLSLQILVEGVFFDRNQDYNSFEFLLDRVYNKKFELAEKVEESLNQYDNSFTTTNKPSIDSFHTKFTYFLKHNKHGVDEGLEIFKNGIFGIEAFIPYVLSFSNDIHSVEIVDNINSNKSTIFSRDVELTKENNNIQIVPIQKRVVNSQTDEQEDSSSTIHIARCHEQTELIDLAVELLKSDDGNFKIKPIDEKLPLIFCTFPLIGSQEWRYPLVLNCSRFHPRTERDGILLTTGKDDGNQKRIEQALSPFKSIVQYAIEKKWKQLYWLAKTDYQNCPPWASEDWYKEMLKSLRDFLKSQPLVVNEKEGHIKMEEALFPSTSKQDNLEEFWEICSEFIPKKIPQKDDAEIWNKIITPNYLTWGTKFKYNIERLLEDIQNEASITQLATNRFNTDNAKAIAWMNRLFSYLLNDADKADLLQKFAVVPNKKGTFYKVGVKEWMLRSDNNGRVPDEVISVYKTLTEKDWSDFLIHPLIIKLDIPEIPTYNISSITRDINNLIESKETANQLKQAAVKQIITYTSSFSEDKGYSQVWRESIWQYANDLDNSTPEIKHIDGLLHTFWEQADRWLLYRMVYEVYSCKTVIGLKAKLKKEEETETLKWLNNFIKFYVEHKKETYYSDKSIFPNQKGLLRTKQEVHFDNHIPKELKTILESADTLLTKTNEWSYKHKLLDKHIIGFNEHQPLSTKEISIRINDFFDEILEEPEESDNENLFNQNPDAFNQIFYNLIALSSEKKEHERKELLKYSYNLIPDKIQKGLKVLSHSDDFDFSKANKWILEHLVSKLVAIGKLEALGEYNDFFKDEFDDIPVVWIDDFINFLYHFEDEVHQHLVEKEGIIPNQNDNFCILNHVKKDGGIPEDLKEISKCEYLKTDWDDFLAHKGLKLCSDFLFDEDNTRFIKDIADELEEGVRNYKGGLPLPPEYSELLFLLNESESVKEDEKNDRLYFPYFLSNKDRLIVSSLGEGEDLENVAQILKNRDTLSVMADLSRTGISTEDLKEYKDAVEKVGADKIRILIQEEREEQETIDFHTYIGELAEAIFKADLESKGFIVKRTGIGSDFSITKENLKVLVEIKSCMNHRNTVKMTSTQADTALRSQYYVLCVIPKEDILPTEYDFRSNSQFVTNISTKLQQSVANGIAIEQQKNKLSSGEISLIFDNFGYKHSIPRSVWESGITLSSFVTYLLNL